MVSFLLFIMVLCVLIVRLSMVVFSWVGLVIVVGRLVWECIMIWMCLLSVCFSMLVMFLIRFLIVIVVGVSCW